jgi:hypothetical protein
MSTGARTGAGFGDTSEVRTLRMVKELAKHGNSLTLVIDRPILDFLKIDPERCLTLVPTGDN